MRTTRFRAVLAAVAVALAIGLAGAPAAHARTDTSDSYTGHAAPQDSGGRQNDSAPYSGGAHFASRYNWAIVQNCTTGFGVHDKNNPNKTYLLTAGHCSPGGTQDIYRSAWGPIYFDRIGTWTRTGEGRDIGLIEAPSGSTIYDGGPGATAFKKDVVGAARVKGGESVCISGSVTGTVCGLTVVGFGQYHEWGWQIALRGPKGVIAATHGDSGGPAFMLTSDPNKVLAVGTITGGSVDDDNQPRLNADGTQDVWISSIDAAIDGFGIEVNTPAPPVSQPEPQPVPDPVHQAPAAPAAPDRGQSAPQGQAGQAPQSAAPSQTQPSAQAKTVSGILRADPMPLRSGPGRSNGKVRDLPQSEPGMSITIDCFATGDEELWGWGGHNSLWDHATVRIGGQTLTGYLADVWVDTGGDIDKAGIPHC